MKKRDVCEMFIEYCYEGYLLDLTWYEVLDTCIDDCTDETWEELFSKYPDDVYNYCYKYHKINKF